MDARWSNGRIATWGRLLVVTSTLAVAGCGRASNIAVKSPAATSEGRGVVVYIRGQATEYGTGRVVAKPPPRPGTLENDLLDETRRKSDVVILAAVAGPGGKVVWMPVKHERKAARR